VKARTRKLLREWHIDFKQRRTAKPRLARGGRFVFRAAIYAGLIAAFVSLLVETPLVWLVTGEAPWTAARMAAAMVLGPEVLPPPAGFDPWIVAVALAIHVALSIAYGAVLGAVVRKLSLARAAGAGAVFGVALFVINLYGIAPVFFPWFEELRGAITLFSHVVFGTVLGAAYVAVAEKPVRREIYLFLRKDRRP
jgi:hypothetical protein